MNYSYVVILIWVLYLVNFWFIGMGGLLLKIFFV